MSQIEGAHDPAAAISIRYHAAAMTPSVRSAGRCVAWPGSRAGVGMARSWSLCRMRESGRGSCRSSGRRS